MADLVVALDFDNLDDAISLAEKIQGLAPWVKIGLELFVSEGPSIVKKFKSMGFKVFLDLKLYDIPNTVKGATHAAINSGADLITLHLSGGKRMCQAALEEVKKQNANTLIFGVSVLTSFEEGELPGYKENLSQMVEILVKGANEWGIHGIVCSGHEVTNMKKIAPNLKFLTPGIRFDKNVVSDDQRRVMTPYDAVIAGSDFLVIGRPIAQAANPKSVCLAILTEVENAKQKLQG